MAISQRDSTLAGAWHPAVRRVLFFSYRFGFRWFHDCVLTLARRQSLEGVQIDVLATRRDEDPNLPARGDLYALDEWAKWQKQLRIHYLRPHRHLFHNKFILMEHAHSGSIELGLGSSNLTNSGWSRNFETWTWTKDAGLQACGEFLRYLQGLPDVNGSVLTPWIKKISRKRPDALQWLWGRKDAQARQAFRAVGAGLGKPAVLRVVSPYFDNGSEELLSLLLTEARLSAHKPKVELWIDGSASVGRVSDYEIVAKLVKRYGPSCQVKKVNSKADAKQPSRPLPLHAKIIEVEDSTGKAKRLLGSANFTSAAWLGTWNTESIHLENDRRSLKALLMTGQEVVPVDQRELRWLRNNATEGDEDDGSEAPCVYWAALDEAAKPRVLTVCYAAPSTLEKYSLQAAFDQTRDRLRGKPQRDAIVAAFEARSNWQRLPASHGLLRLAFQPSITVPELARVTLRFADGRKLQAPIEISAPDFANRDASTGIPIALSIESILGKGQPIVPPRTTRSLAELPGVDDEYDEDVPPVPPDDDKLAADPAYRKEPLAVRMAKLLKRLRGDPALARRVIEKCDALAALPVNPGEAALIAAMKKAAGR